MTQDNLDKFHRHEVMDRLHVAMETISEHIVDHRYMEFNKKAHKQAKKALSILFDCYQTVGADERFGG